VPERLYKVTVTHAGVRNTMEFAAPSLIRAANYFWAHMCANPGSPAIAFKDDTIYEVQTPGYEIVYLVKHRTVLGWTQREVGRVANRLKR
jgi:hypothetical protein